MSMFQLGDVVKPKGAVQGLHLGVEYKVVAIKEHPYGIFGTAYVYTVEDGLGKQYDVTNGHLFLEKV